MAGDGDFQYAMVEDHVIALVHTERSPSDAAWEAHHALINETVGRDRFVEMGYFVITAGGAPTARQRRLGTLQVKGRRMVRSIVTDSFFVRQLVKSWSWFAPGLSAYAPEQLREALLNVGVKADQFADVWPKIAALNAALSPPVPWVPERI
jgi:hypothetical protein